MINLRFPDRGTASLAQVSVMLLKNQRNPYESKGFTLMQTRAELNATCHTPTYRPKSSGSLHIPKNERWRQDDGDRAHLQSAKPAQRLEFLF